MKKFVFTCFLFFLISGLTLAQEAEKRVQWFREAKFGMFIHWGLYAEAAGHWDGKNYYGIGEWR